LLLVIACVIEISLITTLWKNYKSTVKPLNQPPVRHYRGKNKTPEENLHRKIIKISATYFFYPFTKCNSGVTNGMQTGVKKVAKEFESYNF